MSISELKHVSEPVRRIEVFTGAGRRRSWTAAEKAAIVAESCDPEASVCAVARRHGLTPQQLFAWRRALRVDCQSALNFGSDAHSMMRAGLIRCR
jgi:transposase